MFYFLPFPLNNIWCSYCNFDGNYLQEEASYALWPTPSEGACSGLLHWSACQNGFYSRDGHADIFADAHQCGYIRIIRHMSDIARYMRISASAWPSLSYSPILGIVQMCSSACWLVGWYKETWGDNRVSCQRRLNWDEIIHPQAKKGKHELSSLTFYKVITIKESNVTNCNVITYTHLHRTIKGVKTNM